MTHQRNIQTASPHSSLWWRGVLHFFPLHQGLESPFFFSFFFELGLNTQWCERLHQKPWQPDNQVIRCPFSLSIRGATVISRRVLEVVSSENPKFKKMSTDWKCCQREITPWHCPPIVASVSVLRQTISEATESERTMRLLAFLCALWLNPCVLLISPFVSGI